MGDPALRCTGEFDVERDRMALANLAGSPLQRYRHDFPLPHIWYLWTNLTACDAAHVVLAEGLDATLLRRGSGLATVARHRAQIALI
ncbi:MAG: hypothetical protein KGO02_14725 [Alphaproteobacteria bacterium]|nr:hypothetical protein [Alphaproteobacteria bacterium]